MGEDKRHFVQFADTTHPLLTELPQEISRLWFKQYCSSNGELLMLAMERIYENPEVLQSAYADLLTFEIADMEALLEWEEDHGDKPFLAVDPYYIFFDGLENEQAKFSLGDLDHATMDFIPELTIFFNWNGHELVLEFEEGQESMVFYPK